MLSNKYSFSQNRKYKGLVQTGWKKIPENMLVICCKSLRHCISIFVTYAVTAVYALSSTVHLSKTPNPLWIICVLCTQY